MYRDDTIVAIATATGGAVGIVRLSGREAWAIAQRCLSPASALSPRTLTLRKILHPESGRLIDRALVAHLPGAATYTGEESVEIQGHGGALVLRRILEATIAAGARQANPGEFSLRAFLNGKLDLTQAEAVAELIQANHDLALDAAQGQLGGALSRPVQQLRGELLELQTLVEAAIDFSLEEHVYQLPAEDALHRLRGPLDMVQRLLRAFEAGSRALGGYRVALIGAPNAGKSSLFNALLGQERAIVTALPGTTRDLIEAEIQLNPQLRLRLIDTAGLREAKDLVEEIGIERSRTALTHADLCCWVVDATEPLPPMPPVHDGLPLVIALNKADLCDEATLDARQRELSGKRASPIVVLSATARRGMDKLEGAFTQALSSPDDEALSDLPLVTSMRHAEALRRSEEALLRVEEAIESTLPWELVSADLKEGVDALSEIVGAITTEDLLEEIFSNFCVGK